MSITWAGTILIIKDSLSDLDLISSYLEEQGYNIIKATTAKEGLEITLESKPDIIVTDVVMPGRTGFELCRFLKSHSTHQHIPILVCSANNQENYRIWARKQGADAYFTTPFSAEDLLSAIEGFRAYLSK
ncbi:PleD family two-component system response regulator [Nostoc sp. TCL26-01]|uniref:response regulator n=1 Tax=Nostoc sp. TCL26-01 TaxID=2576904 RepID=UPI0015BCB2DA|nr:response regulator [Nostoc sp. TCL26-01]QLE54501.1 response regulator [Nostoc sp. TCL26-01]